MSATVKRKTTDSSENFIGVEIKNKSKVTKIASPKRSDYDSVKLNKPYIALAAIIFFVATAIIAAGLILYFTHILEMIPATAIGGSGVFLGALNIAGLLGYMTFYLYKRHASKDIEISTLRFDDYIPPKEKT